MLLIAVVTAAAMGTAHDSSSPVFASPTMSRPVSVPAPVSRPLPPQFAAPAAQKPHFPARQPLYPALNEPLAACYARQHVPGVEDLYGLGISPGPQCPPLFLPF